MRAKLSCWGLLAGVLLASSNQANAITYTFTDLSALSGINHGMYSDAFPINNSGQVLGYTSSGTPTVWNGSTATYLSPLVAGGRSDALAINNAGQVAGWSASADGGYSHATLWNGTTPTDLGTLAPNGYEIGYGYESYAYALNNVGQAAGYGYASDGYYHAVRWDGTAATELGMLPGGTFSSATAINDAGQVAGYSYIAGGAQHATLWNGSTPIDLGVLPGGGYSQANAINNTGQVVGWSNNAGGVGRAMLWNGTTMTDLGALGGYDDNVSSFASAINNSGQIVGSTTSGGGYAALWNGNTITNLNSFLDASTVSAGWVLYEATAINDKGWITGRAYNSLTGENHVYLLTPPVPEPEAYAMLLAGLGLVGFKSRRRRIA